MNHDDLDKLSPREQENHFMALLDTMPDASRAMMEVVQWMATEWPRDEPVTQDMITAWVEDVRVKNQARALPHTAAVLPFRRKLEA
jgi:hypothetical protein